MKFEEALQAMREGRVAYQQSRPDVRFRVLVGGMQSCDLEYDANQWEDMTGSCPCGDTLDADMVMADDWQIVD